MFGRISPMDASPKNLEASRSSSARAQSKNGKNSPKSNSKHHQYRYDDFILNDTQKMSPTAFNTYNSRKSKIVSAHEGMIETDHTTSNHNNNSNNNNHIPHGHSSSSNNNQKIVLGGFLQPMPGPATYDVQSSGTKRRVKGALIMRARDGPSERELILSNGVHVRNILPAPSSQTTAAPRSISPTLLKAAERCRAFQEKFGKQNNSHNPGNPRQKSPSPPNLNATTRKCDIGLKTREMAARPNVGPGSYDLNGKFLKSNGAYSRGIVFSSSPRLPLMSHTLENGNGSVSRSNSPNSSARGNSPNHNGETQNNNNQQLQQQQQQQQRSNHGNANHTNNGSITGGTFGHSPRILDMNVVNPFLRGPELAPPVGTYNSGNTSARGGNKKVLGIPSLYRRDRGIHLERKTAAPGPAIYESARSTDIWKPVVY